MIGLLVVAEFGIANAAWLISGARYRGSTVCPGRTDPLRARGCSDRRLVTSAAWLPSSTAQVRMGACREAEGTTVAHRAAVTRNRQTTDLG